MVTKYLFLYLGSKKIYILFKIYSISDVNLQILREIKSVPPEN